MAHRPPADVRLGDLRDAERGLHTRVDTQLLQRVLQRQRVQNRREHPHVVSCGPIHPRRYPLHPAVDVPGADDDRDLYALIVHCAHLPGDGNHAIGVGAVGKVPHQRLSRELKKDAFESGLRHPRP
jgi:hypothetical protein